MRIALYQPEIPQNTGTILRLGVCLGVGVDIIEPSGFIWSDQKLKRAGMDYLPLANVKRYPNWQDFVKNSKRIVLLDTKANIDYLDFVYHPQDTLLLGSESNGVPSNIFENISNKIKITMQNGARSLNIAISAAMVLGESLRQTRI